ncbi:MAG: hypothetical protein ACON5K_04700 [Bacteroidia bacterium]
MRNFIIFLLFLIGFNAYSQFNYQSLIKDTNGNVVVNTDIKIRLGIIYDSPTATPIYSEIHQITTPSDGVINILIGDGVAQTGSTSFTSIDWSKNIYVKQEVEIDNSGSFIDFGTNKLNSVPIAEYAKKTSVSSSTFFDLKKNLLIGTDIISSTVTNDILLDSITTIGGSNIAIGEKALENNSQTQINTVIGYKAMQYSNYGSQNVAIGFRSLEDLGTNVQTPTYSFNSVNNEWEFINNEATSNVAIGPFSMWESDKARMNVGIGRSSLLYNVNGNENVAIGDRALRNNNSDFNTGVGRHALWQNENGMNNTAVGYFAGSLSTNSDNTFIGGHADTTTGSSVQNATAIGANAIVTTSNTIQLGDNNVTLVNTYGTVSATAFVGDGSGLTNLSLSGPIYKSSIVEQSSLTAAADSQIDLPGMSFRWNSGKLEIKSEAGNSPQAMTFYFSYHTNSGDTVNFRPDSVSYNSNTWSPVDCSWCNTGSPNIPSITGSYAVYEFDFTVYPLNESGNHYGRTYNVKIFLGGWLGVHMRAFYQ